MHSVRRAMGQGRAGGAFCLRVLSVKIRSLVVLALLAVPACGVKVTPLVPQAAHSPAELWDATAGPDRSLEIGDAVDHSGLFIGGAWVPKNKILVVIHIGHSNMAGRAAHPPELKPHFYEPDPRLWSFRPDQLLTGQGPLRFQPATEPLSGDVATEGRAGPGMALLRAVSQRVPDAHVVSIRLGTVRRELRALRELQARRPVLRVRDAACARAARQGYVRLACSRCSGPMSFGEPIRWLPACPIACAI